MDVKRKKRNEAFKARLFTLGYSQVALVDFMKNHDFLCRNYVSVWYLDDEIHMKRV
jgi:hypothetical protein